MKERAEQMNKHFSLIIAAAALVGAISGDVVAQTAVPPKTPTVTPYPNCPTGATVSWLYRTKSGGKIIGSSTDYATTSTIPADILAKYPTATEIVFTKGVNKGKQQYKCKLPKSKKTPQGRCGKGQHRQIGALTNGVRAPSTCVANVSHTKTCVAPKVLKTITIKKRIKDPSTGVFGTFTADVQRCVNP
jgi:hypothetical protein